MPSGLDHEIVAARKQFVHQRVDTKLLERLSACELHELAFIALHLKQHIAYGHVLALEKRIFSIAIRAAKSTASHAYEYAWLTRTRTFALNRIEDLIDAQHVGSLFFSD